MRPSTETVRSTKTTITVGEPNWSVFFHFYDELIKSIKLFLYASEPKKEINTLAIAFHHNNNIEILSINHNL